MPLLLNICSSKNLTIRPRVHSFVSLLVRFHFDIFNHLMRWGEFNSIWMDSIFFSTSGTISGFFKGWIISETLYFQFGLSLKKKPQMSQLQSTVNNNLRNSLFRLKHGLRTPNEGINHRYLKNWADVADKICFGRT